MKRSRFSEEQIIGILREHPAGAKVVDLCRQHGISDATFYQWKSKYGGMEVSDAKKLEALEPENARLQKLLAEHVLDVATRREMLGKTSDAQCTPECGALGDSREALLTTAGLRLGGAGSTGGSLSLHTSR